MPVKYPTKTVPHTVQPWVVSPRMWEWIRDNFGEQPAWVPSWKCVGEAFLAGKRYALYSVPGEVGLRTVKI